MRSYATKARRAIPGLKAHHVPKTGTYPKGFLVGTGFAGVKKSNTKYDDVAVLVSDRPCPAAAVFTRNIFKAAPVIVSREILDQNQSTLHGVVINSGIANAVTGSRGVEDARKMASMADTCFQNILAKSVTGDTTPVPSRTLVMSTGIIGQSLPMASIEKAITQAFEQLGSEHDSWLGAAHAVCTTDTFPKLLSRTFSLPSHPANRYTIAGITKGAGMIHPNMGTLLGVICTDANVVASDMAPLLRHATDRSFNAISVDGDTSTNDTVAFFANGAAAPHDARPLAMPVLDDSTEPVPDALDQDDNRAFLRILTEFLADLAQLCVRDGEGATKFVTVRVRSAKSLTAARRAASSIATSALVKTALYGQDANWGRILCAIGYAPGIVQDPLRELGAGGGDDVHPMATSVSFVPADGSEELQLLVRGEPQDVDEARAKHILAMEDLEILVRLGDPDKPSSATTHEAVYWTCDFSHEYVTINGDYRT